FSHNTLAYPEPSDMLPPSPHSAAIQGGGGSACTRSFVRPLVLSPSPFSTAASHPPHIPAASRRPSLTPSSSSSASPPKTANPTLAKPAWPRPPSSAPNPSKRPVSARPSTSAPCTSKTPA